MRFLWLAVILAAPSRDALPTFKEQVVDSGFGTCYAVTLADINGDARPDIVVVTEQPDQVVWYENPSWKRRTLVEKNPRLPVCIQPLDVDGDGKVELVLGADWQPSNTKTGGTVWLLQRPGDLEQSWTPIKLDEEPTMHRMRVADLDGKGRKELLCKTLHGKDGKAGEGPAASLFVLKRPADPFKGAWTRDPVPHPLHSTHNFWPIDWDGDGKDEILLAGKEGVLLFKKADAGWTHQKLVDGEGGAGEIKVGRLPGGKRYLATVEPMHGHQAAVYAEPGWKKHVLVSNHKGGHALWTADLTGTGVDSVVVGFRGPPEGKPEECVVYVFHPLDASGTKWEKKTLDEHGLGCEDAICADLNGDGRIDIVGVGRVTKNVKIYWNQGK